MKQLGNYCILSLLAGLICQVALHDDEYLVGYDGQVYVSLFSGYRLDHLSTFPRCIKVKNVSSGRKLNDSLFNVPTIDLTDDEHDRLLLDTRKSSMVVNFDFALLEIIEIDEKQQAVHLSIRTTTKWRDCRLDWDNQTLRTNYIYVEPARFRSLKTFVPNMRLLEENDPKSWADSEIIVKIEHTGYVTVTREYITLASCNIEVIMYPFDTQSCNLTFESPFSKLEVEIVQDVKKSIEETSRSLLGDGRFIPSDTWEVAVIPMGRGTRDKCKGGWKAANKSSRECLVERAMYRLLCHRHPTYQLVNLMFPALLVTLVSTCVFIIPHGAEDKMNLCVTILLSIFIFTQIMYDNMPETGSKLPLISQYYIACVVLISMSCMFAAAGTVLSSWRWRVPVKLQWILKKLKHYLLIRECDHHANPLQTVTISCPCHGSFNNQQNMAQTDKKDEVEMVANPTENAKIDAGETAIGTAVERDSEVTWDEVAAILDRIFFVSYLIVNLITFLFFLLYGFVPWNRRFSQYSQYERDYQRIQIQLQNDEDYNF